MEILGIMFKDQILAERVEVDGKIIFRLNEGFSIWDIPFELFRGDVTEATLEDVIEWAVSQRNPREIGIDPEKMQVWRGIYRCDTLDIVKEYRGSSYVDDLWIKMTDEDTYEKNSTRGKMRNIRKGEIIKLTVN